MSQTRCFGNLKYDAYDHSWAFDLGCLLGSWDATFPLRSCRAASEPEIQQHSSDYKRYIEIALARQGINMQLPIQGPGQRDPPSLNAIWDIVRTVRNAKGTVYCAVLLIAQAGTYLSYIESRSLDAEGSQMMEALSETTIGWLQTNCSDFFPHSFNPAAIDSRLKRTRGDPSNMRQLLEEQSKKMVILLVLADPIDMGRTRIMQEKERLEEGFNQTDHRDRYEIKVLADARPDNVGLRISNYRPSIIHFSGHGNPSGLVLSDRNGRAVQIDPSKLAEIFDLAAEENLEGIIFNACWSAEARQQARLGQDAIVMSGKLYDDGSIAFSEQFYSHLGNGRSFKESFRWANRTYNLTNQYNIKPSFVEGDK